MTEEEKKSLIKSLTQLLIVILIFFTLIGLGIWQLFRYLEKENYFILQSQKTVSSEIPQYADKVISTSNIEFQDISTKGLFLDNQSIYIQNRTLNGKPGVHVFTPLIRIDGDPIFVNRGWVSLDELDEYKNNLKPSNNVSIVEGVIRVPQEQKWGQIDNKPGANQWFFPDLDAMKKARDLDVIMPFYIQQHNVDDPEGFSPQPIEAKLKGENPHFGYMLTWFGLAFLFMIIMYIRFKREPK